MKRHRVGNDEVTGGGTRGRETISGTEALRRLRCFAASGWTLDCVDAPTMNHDTFVSSHDTAAGVATPSTPSTPQLIRKLAELNGSSYANASEALRRKPLPMKRPTATTSTVVAPPLSCTAGENIQEATALMRDPAVLVAKVASAKSRVAQPAKKAPTRRVGVQTAKQYRFVAAESPVAAVQVPLPRSQQEGHLRQQQVDSLAKDEVENSPRLSSGSSAFYEDLTTPLRRKARDVESFLARAAQVTDPQPPQAPHRTVDTLTMSAFRSAAEGTAPWTSSLHRQQQQQPPPRSYVSAIRRATSTDDGYDPMTLSAMRASIADPSFSTSLPSQPSPLLFHHAGAAPPVAQPAVQRTVAHPYQLTDGALSKADPRSIDSRIAAHSFTSVGDGGSRASGAPRSALYASSAIAKDAPPLPPVSSFGALREKAMAPSLAEALVAAVPPHVAVTEATIQAVPRAPPSTGTGVKSAKALQGRLIVTDTSTLLESDNGVLNLLIEKWTLCVPFTVIDELDRMNKGRFIGKPRRGGKSETAEAVTRELSAEYVRRRARELRDWIASALVRKDPHVRVQKRTEIADGYERESSNNDDSILGYAVFLRGKGERHVMFVTEDKFLRVKAQTELGEGYSYNDIKRMIGVR